MWTACLVGNDIGAGYVLAVVDPRTNLRSGQSWASLRSADLSNGHVRTASLDRDVLVDASCVSDDFHFFMP